jgi:hypothetical protein
VADGRILIVATHPWALGARVAIALTKVGFEVAAVSPRGALVRKVSSIKNHYTYWPWRQRASLIQVIRAWRPNFLVCTDDEAVRRVHSLYQNQITRLSAGNASIAKLIEESLGNPSYYPHARERSKFILCAQALGVRCPKTIVVANKDALEGGTNDLAYPLIVKVDGTYAGMGVRRARNKTDAQNLVDFFGRAGQTVCLQQYITGRPANRAVICHRGQALAGISVETIESPFEFGPASVVRTINHPEMVDACDRLVAHLGLSGFVGFDFILDAKNQAWLLELNPRVTPICHLNFTDGTDLASTLRLRLSGVRVTRTSPIPLEGSIALFPNGIVPKGRIDHLSAVYFSSHHDVPWDELALVRASIDAATRRTIMTRITDRLSGFWERDVPPSDEADGKLGAADLQKR